MGLPSEPGESIVVFGLQAFTRFLTKPPPEGIVLWEIIFLGGFVDLFSNDLFK